MAPVQPQPRLGRQSMMPAPTGSRRAVTRVAGATLLAAAVVMLGRPPLPARANEAPRPTARHARQQREKGSNSTMQPGHTTPRLEAHFARSGDQLVVRYTIYNPGDVAILVFNRLWNGVSERAPDAARAYRFILGDTLRLWLGPAPLPADRMLLFRNDPLVVKIDARRSFSETIALSVPVKEYSPYFTEAPGDYTAVTTQRIELVIGYVQANDLKTAKDRLYPDALSIESPDRGALSHLRSSTCDLELKVERHNDPAFTRYGG